MRTVLALLLVVALCAAAPHKRNIHLQNGVIDPLSEDAPTWGGRADGAPAEYLVQVQPPVTPDTLAAIEKAVSIKFVNDVRIPHHSFLVVATHAEVERLEAHPLVLYVTDFIASYKYPAALAKWDTAGAKSVELVVVLHSVASTNAAKQLVGSWTTAIKQDLGAEIRLVAARTATRVQIKIPAAKFFPIVQWLARQVGSLWIEPAIEYTSFANKATGIVESGVPGRANVLESAGLSGAGTIVSLADTGLKWQSCFFNQTTQPTSNFSPNDSIVVYNVDGGDQTDATGHGTAMAALIAGNPTSASFTAYRGLAPKAKIAFTDISSGSDGSYTGPSDIYAYLDQAKNYSSTVVVGAFGTTSPVSWYTTRDADVDGFLYLFQRSVTAVFAAGNFGQTSGGSNVPGFQLASPGTAKNVISVGASQNDVNSVITAAGANTTVTNAINADLSQWGHDILAPFSSKGPAFDGRLKPDVVAPGMGIFTASTADCDIGGVEGTSFSAALVGAAAVLVRQYLRLGYRGSGSPVSSDEIVPSAALIKAAIINSGMPLAGYSAAAGKFFGTNNQLPHPAYGFGRVNLENVLYLDTPAFGALSLFSDSSAGVVEGQTQKFCFDVTGVEKDLKVTLVWTDPQGSLVSGFTLTNNLDLLVMDPNGRTFFANGLETFDSINNVEQVLVQDPVPGSWVALIHGLSVDAAVSSNGQLWSIVVSGNVSEPQNGCPTRCPHACSGQGTCNSGTCTCTGGRFGIDCSLTACPNNCTAVDGTLNGICNPITATCECASQFGGADCRQPANETTVTVIRRKKGLSNGAVAGIAVGTFFAGAILCAVIGFFAAIQYLIWKRKNHKKLMDEGKGGKGGGL